MGSEILAPDADTDLVGSEQKATEGAAAGSQAPAHDETRLTTKYMTKYERARIIGTRALQLRYAMVAL
jgi:DNA-directed RNA polymerase I, II, and III subunit RPABC2